MMTREASLPIARAADEEQPEEYLENDNDERTQTNGSWFGGGKKKKKRKKKKRSSSTASRYMSSRYGLDVLGGGLIVRTINMLLLMCTTLWFAFWVTLAFSDIDKLIPGLSETFRDLAAEDGLLGGATVSRNESDLLGVQGLLLGCEFADVESAVQQPINAYVGGIFFLIGLFCLMLTVRDFAMGTKRSSNTRKRQSTVVSRQQGGLQSFVQEGPTGQDILPHYNVPTRPSSLLVNHALWSFVFTINFLSLGVSTFLFHSTNTEEALRVHAATWWFLLVSVFTYSVARFVSLSATNGGPESCCVLDDRCGCTCAVECSPSAGRIGMLTITAAGVAVLVIGDVVIWHNINVMIGLTESAQITLSVFAGLGLVSTFLTAFTMSHEIKSARVVGILALLLGAVAATLFWVDTQPDICDEFSIFQIHALANVIAASACLASYIFFRGDLRVGYVERTIEQREKILSLLSSRASVSSSHRSMRLSPSPLGGVESMSRSAGSLNSDGRDHHVINRVNTTSSMSSDRSRRNRSGSVSSNASASSRGSRSSRSLANNKKRNNNNNNNNNNERNDERSSERNIRSSNRRSAAGGASVSDDSSGSTGSPRRGGEARHHISSDARSVGSNGSASRRSRSNNNNRKLKKVKSAPPAAPERRQHPDREPEQQQQQQQAEADVSDNSSVTSGGSRGSRGSRNSDNSGSTRLSAGRVRMSAMAPILEADGDEHHIATVPSAADGANRLSGDPQVRLARLRERQRALREERAKGMSKNKNSRRNKNSSNNSSSGASQSSRSSVGSSSSSGRNSGMQPQRAGGAMSRGSNGSGSSGGGGGRGRGTSESSRVIAHWTCSRCEHTENELQDAQCNVCRHRRPPLSDMMRVTQQQ